MLPKSWCSYYLPAIAALITSVVATVPVFAQLETIPTGHGPEAVPYPTVPTDVTGPGGSHGYSQDIRKLLLGPDRNTVPYNEGIIVARDGRYSFTGKWMPLYLAGCGVALAPAVNTLSAVIPVATPKVLPPSVFFPTRDIDATRTPPTVQIMHSCNASYAQAAPGQLALNQGALLLKTTDAGPVDVTAPVGSQLVDVRLTRGAYALISVFAGHMTVADFSDNARGAVTIGVRNCDGNIAATVLRVGHMALIYPTCSPCKDDELVAYTVLGKNPLPGGLTIENLRFSYPRALKRFNMTANIGDCDLRRLLKTAAAVSYVDREREWLGAEPYAP